MRKLHLLEESLSVFTLLSMALIPLLEVVIRRFYPAGIPGADLWVQHLVLWVAFMGAGSPQTSKGLLRAGPGPWDGKADLDKVSEDA